jgi:hypothetical protein
MKFDWKFFASTLIAIAGVLAPIWLWQSDQDSRALTLTVVSKTPIATNSIDGLQVTLDNQSVKNLYVSSIDLINTGSKPIQTSDFDAPIKIQVGTSAKLLRAKIENTSPKDIKPSIEFNNSELKIAPLLLNPKDKMRISIISSENSPEFTPASRISGISAIEMIDNTTPSKQERKMWFRVAVAIMLLTIYAGGFILLFHDFVTSKLNLTHLYVTFVSVFGGVALLSTLEEGQPIEQSKITYAMIVAAILTGPYYFKYAKLSGGLLKARLFGDPQRKAN